MASKYLFYPGCSLEAGGGYLESINAVCKILDVDLTELRDWNCCGATVMKGYHRAKSAITAARNFSLAKRQGATGIVVVCNACLSTLVEQRNLLREDAELRELVKESLAAGGHELALDIDVKHLLDVFVEEVGIEKIASHVKQPLKDDICAAYYGCLYTRPAAPHIDCDNPQYLERVLRALGGKTIEFAAKMDCCGASQAVGHPDVGRRMVGGIMSYAARRGTDAVVTICPLCNFNLEASKDADVEASPHMGVFFFTQAMGLAFGLKPEDLGMKKLLMPPEKVLSQVRTNA